jgi:hypothetical protein
MSAAANQRVESSILSEFHALKKKSKTVSMISCEVCEKTFQESYLSKHNKGVRHLKNVVKLKEFLDSRIVRAPVKSIFRRNPQDFMSEERCQYFNRVKKSQIIAIEKTRRGIVRMQLN